MFPAWPRALALAPLLLGLVGCEEGGLLGLGGGQCGDAPEVPRWALTTGRLPAAGVEGHATVASVAPFTLAFDEGWQRTMVFDGPQTIPRGARVYAAIDEDSFGLSDRGGKVTLHALGPDGSLGKLAFAAWYGPRYSALDFEAVSYTTRPTGSVCTDDCGHRYRAQIYRVRVGQVEVEVQGEAEVGPYMVWTGGYVDEGSQGSCEDHSLAQLFGGRAERSDLTFELDSDPVNCQTLSPDACIQHPRCALFGGDQVPYACRTAIQGCERTVDASLCARNPECVWMPGECYCPEGESCRCMGGSAPGCRMACAARGSYSNCPPGELRFCEALDPSRSDCVPYQPGACQRRPAEPECAEQSLQVCGCSPRDAGQWSLLPACTRAHLGLSFVRTSTHCEP